MKIKLVIAHVLKDRFLVFSWLLLTFLTLLMSVIFAFRIHPSELTLPVRYTAFGFTFVYNDAWYYLIGFILFGFVVLGLHTAITMKLFAQKGAGIARIFILLTLILAVISYFLISSILGLAALPQ